MASGQGNLHLNRGGYASQPQSSTPFSMQMPGSITSLGMGMQQQHQYPGINSIPGMHSMNNMGGIQNIQGLQGMPGMQSFQSMPGIPAMQSLLHPPQETNQQTMSTSHISNQFGSSGVLSGGVDKRRKTRKTRNLPYGTMLSGDDATTMMMAAQHAAQVASHTDPVGSMPTPTPIYEADGIQFKVLEQLPDTKIQRLRTEKIKPIESLTFGDIKAYNRNQLRAYCSVYGIRRKKKAEMERDMARYAALFHPNDPNYDWQKFEPTEYAAGPIPRRKVPVTKEQKEKAAGDFKRLTNALQQRPPASTIGSHHYSSVTNSHHHALSNTHHNYHHPTISAPRLPDIHGTHHNTAHSSHHHASHHGHHDEHDAGVVTPSELMSVPEMHVPNHLLSISHQIPEE